MNVELARFNMIQQQIRPWSVLDPVVLDLLERVRREDFVPAAHRSLAFVDTQVPLLEGAPQGACMLEPRVEARLLQELQLKRHERVLEVGTGSGFMACLLGHLSAGVVTLEIHAELAARARTILEASGPGNVQVRQADGSAGLPGEGPFDVIVLSGSVSAVPRALLEQLRVGGRLVAIVGEEPIMRARLSTRVSDTAWTDTELFDTVAPRLLHFPEPSPFKF
ncbi:MAG: protein-L-isoaspartate O-methyltransferase family protein [Rubrivivax sp.]|jgi:protein-L-isoaspartate(D-aspartate) O-methyltransferase